MIVCTHTHLYEFFFITYSAVYINHISKELNLHVLIGSRIWSSHLIYIYIYALTECLIVVLFFKIFILQAVEVPDDILKIKREIDAEINGEDQNWSRAESNVIFLPALNAYPIPPFFTGMTD